MQKAYSKKWIDDISDLNLNLNPLNLLSDSVCYFNNKFLLDIIILKRIFLEVWRKRFIRVECKFEKTRR